MTVSPRILAMLCGVLLACACASTPSSEEPSATGLSASAADPVGTPSDAWVPAKEGESCGDGMMGRPNQPCEEGLQCDMTNVTPAAPPGAAGSTTFGTCRKAQ